MIASRTRVVVWAWEVVMMVGSAPPTPQEPAPTRRRAPRPWRRRPALVGKRPGVGVLRVELRQRWGRGGGLQGVGGAGHDAVPQQRRVRRRRRGPHATHPQVQVEVIQEAESSKRQRRYHQKETTDYHH